MAHRLRDAVPGGHHPLRAAVWEFLRPMLSPRLAELHRDAFVIDEQPQSTVGLAVHRGESSLEALDLDEAGSTVPEPTAQDRICDLQGGASALPSPPGFCPRAYCGGSKM
jgi:hypothetical protein